MDVVFAYEEFHFEFVHCHPAVILNPLLEEIPCISCFTAQKVMNPSKQPMPVYPNSCIRRSLNVVALVFMAFFFGGFHEVLELQIYILHP
jgi:hypothetical protein